jgi:hypothetical protein
MNFNDLKIGSTVFLKMAKRNIGVVTDKNDDDFSIKWVKNNNIIKYKKEDIINFEVINEDTDDEVHIQEPKIIYSGNKSLLTRDQKKNINSFINGYYNSLKENHIFAIDIFKKTIYLFTFKQSSFEYIDSQLI